MFYRRTRVRAKALAIVATFALVLSFFGFLSSPTVTKADWNTNSYNYGNVLLGQSVTQIFTYTAPTDVNLISGTFTGAADVFQLSLSGNQCIAGKHPAGYTCSFNIKFAPLTVGTFHATLTFVEQQVAPTQNDPSESISGAFQAPTTNVSVELVGTGVVQDLNPARLNCSLSVSPDRTLAINPETVVGVSFKVTNNGVGSSFAQHLDMPFSPSLVAGYTTFSDPSVWVSRVGSDSLTVEMPNLAPGKSFEGTIYFRPNSDKMPVNGQEVTFGYDVPFYDALGKHVCQSNEATVTFVGQNVDETTGKVMEMTPAALVATAGDKVEATAKSFAPSEKVSSWITSPDGVSKALADSRADDTTGDYTVMVDTTGFTAGDYVIAVYGHDSEITFRAVLTVK